MFLGYASAGMTLLWKACFRSDENKYHVHGICFHSNNVIISCTGCITSIGRECRFSRTRSEFLNETLYYDARVQADYLRARVCVYYRSIVVNLLYTIAACGEQRRRWWFTRAPFVWMTCWIQIWLVFGLTDVRKTLVKIIPRILCHSVPPPPRPHRTYSRSPFPNERKTETHKIQWVIDLSYTRAQRVGERRGCVTLYLVPATTPTIIMAQRHWYK